jgi:hypothetical protein
MSDVISQATGMMLFKQRLPAVTALKNQPDGMATNRITLERDFMKQLFFTAAAILITITGFAPVESYARDQVLTVRFAPPAPRHEPMPVARRGFEWAPGFWNWNGRRHVWTKGHWERARTGYALHAPSWERSDGNWRMNQGGWQKISRDRDNNRSRNRDRDRDRDRDGVPNRADNHPNNSMRR